MSSRFRAPDKPPRTASPVVRDLFHAMRVRRLPVVDVAVEMDMTRVGLAYWKSGRSDPSITQVEALAQVLGYRLTLEPVEPGTPDL